MLSDPDSSFVREPSHVDIFKKRGGLGLLLYECLIHQLSREVSVLFGAGVGLFFEIGSGCVTTFDDLVVEEGFVEFFEASGEFACVNGTYAVILGCGEDEGFGIVRVGVELIVGGDVGEELSLLRDGDSAVFSDPGCACGDLFVAEHIEQGNLDDDGIPHLGVLSKLDAHEEPSVGATYDAHATGRGDLAGEEILADCSEVLVNAFAMGFEASVMPGWAELTATTYVGKDEGSASLKP